MGDCIFCKLVNGDIPSEVHFSNDHIIAFSDINPVAPVHVLIIPKKHLSSLDETSASDNTLLGDMMLVAKNLAKRFDLRSGYRLVLNNGEDGGQTVEHLHLHLIGGRSFKWPPG